jgi:hypothetical protein
VNRWITTTRIGLGIVVVLVIGLMGFELAMLFREADAERYYAAADRKKLAMVDKLNFVDTPAAFAAGQMARVKLIAGANDDAGPARVALSRGGREKGFPIEGTWISPVVAADFPFTELLPSWNVATPTDTGVVFHVRTRDAATDRWTPWLRIGAWGRYTSRLRTDACEFGKVDTDTLFLDRPANAYQVRAALQSFDLDRAVTPSIRRIAVTYSGALDESSAWAKQSHPDPGPSQRWARDLKVPYRAQGDNASAVTGMTCSPTSVSMVLHYWGVDRPTMENALAIWDDHNDLFGNWSNNTQRASELGMDAWLQRFRNWDQVKEEIAQGHPVVASINFAKGTVPDYPIYAGTDGHLIVIRGFDPDGKVIVNDPASKAKGDGVRYSQSALTHAWFGNGGVGYVIRPPAKPLPASLVKLPAGSLPSAPTTLPTTVPVAAR